MAIKSDPIELAGHKWPNTLSVTLMQKHSACPRSAFLYLEHEGGPSSPEMIRGSAVHTAIERCLMQMLLDGVERMPALDVAREIAQEVISEGVPLGRETDEYQSRVDVPFEEHDYVRMCVFRWAEHFRLTGVPCGVEQMMALDIGGWTVRGKLDLAASVGDTLRVWDWKTSRNMPAHDEISVQHPAGYLMPKQAQIVLYGLLARFGQPVSLVDGEWVRGERWPMHEAYELRLVYPGIENDEGLYERGPLILRERDLWDYRRGLEAQVQSFQLRLENDDWPAVPSTQACSECTASAECPIPARLRDWSGTFRDLEHAEEIAEALYVTKRQSADVQRALRAQAAAQGWDVIRCGLDRAFTFEPKVSGGRVSTEFRDRKVFPLDEEKAA